MVKASLSAPTDEHAIPEQIIDLPFNKVTARAIIIRRKDGALLGVLHRKDGMFSPPGGMVEEGETPSIALLRELEEEKITLIGLDLKWRERLDVDYFKGYETLNLHYVMLVDDAVVGESEEILETRWLNQDQDVWYPELREKMILTLKRYIPDLLYVNLGVMDTW